MIGNQPPARGHVYWAILGDEGEKPYLVVSANTRNRQLRDCIAVRITTTRKPEMASIVPLGPNDPLVGSVLCDDLVVIYRDELRRNAGALTRVTMERVSEGLRAALGL